MSGTTLKPYPKTDGPLGSHEDRDGRKTRTDYQLRPDASGLFYFSTANFSTANERLRHGCPVNPTLTAVAGLEVGHYTDRVHATGCTVVICRQGAVGGVDVRGGSPGTRETDLLRPIHQVDRLHAVVLSGGSAFGLESASGVARYLEEQGVGISFGPAIVPIVSAAILFDLGLVTSEVRPGSVKAGPPAKPPPKRRWRKAAWAPGPVPR